MSWTSLPSLRQFRLNLEGFGIVDRILSLATDQQQTLNRVGYASDGEEQGGHIVGVLEIPNGLVTGDQTADSR